LFAFFYHMLPEGANKQAICAQLRIDSADDFGLLLATAQSDAIGAVRVVQMDAP
jgi:serine/threonine-protein kinase HipA